MPPRKREVEELRSLKEPTLDSHQRENFLKGVALFNQGKYWHAHEAWEAAWLPMGDGPEDDGEIFFRALIQLASGLHLKKCGRYHGARNHFSKAGSKFAVMPGVFLGLDTVALRIFSAHQLSHFDQNFTCLLRLRGE
ncbi:MAG: DUF309 domain-containing protein [Bacteroidetes bacterium]|nr:DUF309 domain-containing protein [Bacteroidota bacterium]